VQYWIAGMTGSAHTYQYMAPVLRLESGMKQHYVPIPAEVSDPLVESGTRRVLATVNGYTINRGIMGRKDGERYLMLSRQILKEMGADYGDVVTVSLEPDPNPDHIELGEEFQAALDLDPEASTRFFSFPPGGQRSLAYYVNSAKREETRINRALEITHKLRTQTLHGDR
jgi:hypothetical protein